jgi:3'-phosphoadenosine 5'-phosphosulfate sulfotransferase (PAPS reductase)/FAD synthetase
VRDIVNYSMGICSAHIACRLKDDGQDPICLFSDTKREDEDTYRFGYEVARRWGLTITDASDGRDLWDVFRSWKMIPARQVAGCSRQMKIEPSQKFLAAFEGAARVAYGYDRTEEDRAERTRARWAFPNLLVWFPLIEWEVDKAQCFGYFARHGVEPPRVYQHFQHANCLPCKNFMRKDWEALAYHYPEKFAEALAFEAETGLRWMQDGPHLSELAVNETPSRKGRRKLAMAEPAFDFTIGCDRCAID